MKGPFSAGDRAQFIYINKLKVALIGNTTGLILSLYNLVMLINLFIGKL